MNGRNDNHQDQQLSLRLSKDSAHSEHTAPMTSASAQENHLTAVPAGHQVLTSMRGIDQPILRRGRGRPRKHPKDPVANAVKVMITKARAEAHTIQEKLAQVINPTAWALSPMSQRRHPTEADIGWAAGILDGEGCVHIARQTYRDPSRRPTYRLRLTIAQNQIDVLQEFEWIVGLRGSIRSPKPTKKQNRVCHYLNFDGMKAFVVLQKLKEHLRRKREHVKTAEDFRRECDIHVHPGPRGTPLEVWERREWYYNRMGLLNGGQ